MKTIDFFDKVNVTLNRDVEVSDEFEPLDERLFVHTGKFESSDRGAYEICIVQKGSEVVVNMLPNGQYQMRDGNGGGVAACLMLSDFNLPPNTEFVKAMQAVPGKSGLFGY